MKQKNSVVQMVSVAMLSSIAYLLMMLDFPFPGLPPFLKIDFSDVPALIAAILFSPIAGVVVEGIKNILHYGIQGSLTGVPIGEVANFVAGCLFIGPAAFLFRKHRTVKSLTTGLMLGTVMMSIIMGVLNYFIILPAYTWFLDQPAMSSSSMRQTVVAAILPFNLIKGIVVTIVFVALFSRLKVWLFAKMKNA
ncbi:ECF transporter S component [Bacillus sp. C1]